MGILDVLFGKQKLGERELPGTFESFLQQIQTNSPLDRAALDMALRAALSGRAPFGGRSMHLTLSSLTKVGGLDGVWAWLPTKSEMRFFLAFLYLNPHFFGQESISPADKDAKNCINSISELHTILRRLEEVKVADERDLKLVNTIYCPIVEWFGSFDELVNESTAYARQTRQQFRAARSGSLMTRADTMDGSPIASDELPDFQNCFDWGRLKVQIW